METIASETFQILERYIKSDSEYNTEHSQRMFFVSSIFSILFGQAIELPKM